MDKIVDSLSERVNESFFKDNENVFFTVSNINGIENNQKKNHFFSNFLVKSNISSIHIYNRNRCENNILEYQTFSFEMKNGIILQCDKCPRLKPKSEKIFFENSRVISITINKQWTAFMEKQ